MSQPASHNFPLLGETQKRQFIDDGYLVVSGLIPDVEVAKTRDGILSALDMLVDDPSTWKRDQAVLFDHYALTVGCMTSGIHNVADQLVGTEYSRGPGFSPYRDAQGQDPWMPGFIPVLNYPVAGEAVFEPPQGYHIDGMHTTTLWPTKLFLVLFVYLTDTPAFGGATALWPGGHRKAFEYWLQRGTKDDGTISDTAPELFPLLGDAVPFVGKAGDVLFMHYLMPHNGTPNHSGWIRMGLNSGIQPDPARPYQRKHGQPDATWTPMDYSLASPPRPSATPP